VLEEQLGRRGDAVAPLRPVLSRTLADVQERLIFRAQTFVKVRARAAPGGAPPCRCLCNALFPQAPQVTVTVC
jgi:hypothetical protein